MKNIKLENKLVLFIMKRPTETVETLLKLIRCQTSAKLI